VRTHAAAALAAVAVPTPSPVVAAHVGTPSVAEAAALLSAGADGLLVPKRRSAHATCAIARQAPPPVFGQPSGAVR
jgi:cobalt-precorrin 5A hydrolase